MKTTAQSEEFVRFKTFKCEFLTRNLHQRDQSIMLPGRQFTVLAMLQELTRDEPSRETRKKRQRPEHIYVDLQKILNKSMRMGGLSPGAVIQKEAL